MFEVAYWYVLCCNVCVQRIFSVPYFSWSEQDQLNIKTSWEKLVQGISMVDKVTALFLHIQHESQSVALRSTTSEKYNIMWAALLTKSYTTKHKYFGVFYLMVWKGIILNTNHFPPCTIKVFWHGELPTGRISLVPSGPEHAFPVARPHPGLLACRPIQGRPISKCPGQPADPGWGRLLTSPCPFFDFNFCIWFRK